MFTLFGWISGVSIAIGLVLALNIESIIIGFLLGFGFSGMGIIIGGIVDK